MEELQELRHHHDAMPDPAPESVERARARLNAHMRRPRTRRVRPVWGLSLAGGAAAALLAVAVTVFPQTAPEKKETPLARPSTTVTELRIRPVANAADLAGNAAVLAAGEPVWTAESEQWGYVKTANAQTRVDGGEWLRGAPEVTNTREMWRRLNDKAFAAMEEGELKIYKGSEFEVTYPYLLALPTDPGQLLARVYETVDAENARNRESIRQRVLERAKVTGKTPEETERAVKESLTPFTSQDRDRWAFQLIAMGMGDAALPARLRAAMYGAMARIPGVRYEAKSSDLLKRQGITLYHVLDGYLRDEIFVNPKTYEYLGYRTVVVKDHQDPMTPYAKGEIHHWSALVTAGVVDEAGQRP